MNSLVTEVYVDKYLESRLRRGDYPPEACRAMWVLIRRYRKSRGENDWYTTRVCGELLVEMAQVFRGEDDYPERFVQL